jgi:hypothetical protein
VSKTLVSKALVPKTLVPKALSDWRVKRGETFLIRHSGIVGRNYSLVLEIFKETHLIYLHEGLLFRVWELFKDVSRKYS